MELQSVPVYLKSIYIVYELYMNIYTRENKYFSEIPCAHTCRLYLNCACIFIYVYTYVQLQRKKTLAKITTTQKNKTKLQIDEQNNNAEKAL